MHVCLSLYLCVTHELHRQGLQQASVCRSQGRLQSGNAGKSGLSAALNVVVTHSSVVVGNVSIRVQQNLWFRL